MIFSEIYNNFNRNLYYEFSAFFRYCIYCDYLSENVILQVPKFKKKIENNLLSLVASYRNFEDIVAEQMTELNIDKKDLPKLISKLEKDMHKAAKILDFERAAEIRDQLKKLREMVEK
mgnify:CR=1 FL=1